MIEGEVVADRRKQPDVDWLHVDVEEEHDHDCELQWQGNPEGEHSDQSDCPVEAVDENAIEVVAVGQINLEFLGVSRSKHVVHVCIPWTLKNAPVDPDAIVIIVWLITFYDERETGRVVFWRDLWFF